MLFLLIVLSVAAFAGAGAPNYSMGANSLTKLLEFIGAMGKASIGIIYAGAAIMALYSATTIYIKLQTGDEGFLKSVTMLLGAILFLFSAIRVLPAFFGLGGQVGFF